MIADDRRVVADAGRDTEAAAVEVHEGDSPVILGFPHTGTGLPRAVREALNERGRELTDTDWHVEQLYAGLLPGATTVRARFHRYLVDANRDPDGTSLYPGQATTGLVPLTDFDGHAIWHERHLPDEAEVRARVLAWHAPYHRALSREIERVRRRHGVAILHDCHSIRSHVPRLFDGRLPDLNIGTDGGSTCDARVERTVVDAVERSSSLSSVLNGRFRGGWTTRRYGRPASGVHAIQMETAQSAYLVAEEAPWTYDEARASTPRAALADALAALERLAPRLAAGARERGLDLPSLSSSGDQQG